MRTALALVLLCLVFTTVPVDAEDAAAPESQHVHSDTKSACVNHSPGSSTPVFVDPSECLPF
jgi:hypothetical protein